MSDLLDRIARGVRIPERVVLVSAHPDDEVLALGSRLRCFDDLLILHLTDGAPRDLGDARRAGFGDWQGYAAARRRELADALEVLEAGAVKCGTYGYPDQEAILHVREATRRLEADLTGAAAVVTHPYEFGHPDHDAAALAVALACDALGPAAPERYEFPSYHLKDGERRFWAFWPDPSAVETVVRLNEAQRAEKRRALDRFVSQAHLLADMQPGDERLRRAPRYDFRAPAPPGEALYDRFGWRMTSAMWLGHAARALDDP